MQPGGQGYGGGPGYGPQAYGGGQGYGVPPQAQYGAPGNSALADRVRSMAGPTVALLGARAALPILFRVLAVVGVRLGEPAVYDGIRALLGMVAVIFYFIWFARLYGWIRAAKGGTQYSTGMAIGGWFIPFANMVFPYLALNDAYKRANDGQGSPLVILWWLSYLGATFLAVFFSLMQSTHGSLLPGGASSNALLAGLAWANTLAQVAAYGVWAMLVKELTAKAR